MNEKKLGIDFGTCYSSAALIKDGNPTPVKFGANLTSLPSSAYVDKDKKIVVGQLAENKRGLDPSRYKREFKRDLGAHDPFFLGTHHIYPQDLTTEILIKLKSEAESQFFNGETVTSAMITVPANYKENKRELMMKAAEAAGFEQVDLMEEPVAAAIYYANSSGMKIEEGEVILVYDLGGGTFDAALIQKQNSGYTSLSLPVGHEQIGGTYFDRLIYSDLSKRASPRFREIIQGKDKKGLLTRLMAEDECRKIKHHLSEDDEAALTLPLESLEEYTLTQESFNNMIASEIDKTIEQCNNLINNAGIEWDKVSRILLIGGSCRIPYVRQMVEKRLNRPVFLVDEPELAVCFGAAVYGNEIHNFNQLKSLPSITKTTNIVCPHCYYEFEETPSGYVQCPECESELNVSDGGVELYRVASLITCPVCKKEQKVIVGRRVSCNNCHSKLMVDDYGYVEVHQLSITCPGCGRVIHVEPGRVEHLSKRCGCSFNVDEEGNITKFSNKKEVECPNCYHEFFTNPGWAECYECGTEFKVSRLGKIVQI